MSWAPPQTPPQRRALQPRPPELQIQAPTTPTTSGFPFVQFQHPAPPTQLYIHAGQSPSLVSPQPYGLASLPRTPHSSRRTESASPRTPTPSSEGPFHCRGQDCKKVFKHASSLSRHRKETESCRPNRVASVGSPSPSPSPSRAPRPTLSERQEDINEMRQKIAELKQEEAELVSELQILQASVAQKRRDRDYYKGVNRKLDSEIPELKKQNRKRKRAHSALASGEENVEGPSRKRRRRKEYNDVNERAKRRKRELVRNYGRAVFGEKSHFNGFSDIVTTGQKQREALSRNRRYTKIVRRAVKQQNKETMAKFSGEPNETRTIEAIFSGPKIMSKQTFMNLQKCNREAGKKEGVPLVRFSDYHNTRQKVFRASGIRGELVEVSSLVEGSKAKGLYRRLKGVLLCLAEKVLSRPDFRWLVQGVLHTKWGGDGAPLNNETVTDYALTLAEFRGDVHQPLNNLLVFCAFVSEGSRESLAYAEKFEREMERLAGQKLEVRFKRDGVAMVEEVCFAHLRTCADQAMLWKLLGELSNSATYPYSFVKVRGDDKNLKDVSSKLGYPSEPGANLYPWSMEERKRTPVAVRNEVRSFKAKHGREPSRQHLTLKICAGILETRIEKENHIGAHSNLVEVCILHVSLTAWCNWYKDFLEAVIVPLCGPIGEPKVECLPERHPLKLFLLASETMNSLTKKVAALWDNATKGKIELTYKFRGEEVKKVCHEFPALLTASLNAILALRSKQKEKYKRLKTLVCFFMKQGVLLREITSLASRTEISREDKERLESVCLDYGVLKIIGFEAEFHRQIDFLIRVILPFRARVLYEEMELGIGWASTQALEQLHYMIKLWMKNTQPTRRFQQVFQYQHIKAFYLPVRLGILGIHSHQEFEYVPSEKLGGEGEFCESCRYVGCKICANPDLGAVLCKIEKSIQQKEWLFEDQNKSAQQKIKPKK